VGSAASDDWRYGQAAVQREWVYRVQTWSVCRRSSIDGSFPLQNSAQFCLVGYYFRAAGYFAWNGLLHETWFWRMTVLDVVVHVQFEFGRSIEAWLRVAYPRGCWSLRGIRGHQARLYVTNYDKPQHCFDCNVLWWTILAPCWLLSAPFYKVRRPTFWAV